MEDNATGYCACPDSRAMPGCSYIRTDPTTAGGLNIGLPFVGVPGVGNIMLGRMWQGALQIVCMWSIIVFGIISCCVASKNTDAGVVVYTAGSCGAVFLIFTALIWSIVNGVEILDCKYPDNQGYATFIS